MTDLSDTVIEAAAKARYEHIAGCYPGWLPWERLAAGIREEHAAAMSIAIRAADAARAEQGYVLVRREDLAYALEDWRDAATELNAAPNHDPLFSGWWTPKDQRVHNRLTAALTDGGTVTEGEPTP